jgi:hypothetical protein
VEIDTGVWERGREIFERTKSLREFWGDSATRQTHTFPPREDLEAPTLTVIGPETRARFIEMARQEFEGRGADGRRTSLGSGPAPS